MKKDSKAYLIVYTLLITIISGSLLGIASKGLESYKVANEKLELQKSIVNTFMKLPESSQEIVDIYNKRVKNYVVNAQGTKVEGMSASKVNVGEEYSSKRETPRRRNLPVYEIYGEDGKGEVLYYVFPLYGFGLWDVIWGYIALDAKDFNTIKGVVLAQKGETPGLGARISDKEIHDRYTGKKIYNAKGQLQRVVMQRGEHQGKSIEHYKAQDHQIDGMSGATITGNGVNAMFKEYLKLYDGFIQQTKK